MFNSGIKASIKKLQDDVLDLGAGVADLQDSYALLMHDKIIELSDRIAYLEKRLEDIPL